MSLSDLRIGQTVEVGDGALGIVRYIGQPLFAPGDWIGVELEDGGGKNDGSVRGERYFECEMGRGMFVRPAAITIIDQPAPPPPKPAPTRRQPGRQSSVSGPSGSRRTSSVPDATAVKRRSQNAMSPTPGNRQPSSMLRVSMFCAQRFQI
jgi:dynactin 1